MRFLLLTFEQSIFVEFRRCKYHPKIHLICVSLYSKNLFLNYQPEKFRNIRYHLIILNRILKEAVRVDSQTARSDQRLSQRQRSD